jgi:hypothetical protein
VKNAENFQDILNRILVWLGGTERTLSSLSPVSRVLATVIQQKQEIKELQADLRNHEDVMNDLDKAATHLKYFSQKQDVVLVKNLLSGTTPMGENPDKGSRACSPT